MAQPTPTEPQHTKRVEQAPVLPPVDTDDGGREVAARLARLVQYLSFESELKTRDRILQLKPEVREGLSKAVRLFEIAVMPSQSRPGAIQVSEPQADTTRVVGDSETIAATSVPDIKNEQGEPLSGTTFLRNLLGNLDDLNLTTNDAEDITRVLLTMRGALDSRVKLPWKEVLEDRFHNVPIEEIAIKYDVSSAQRLREYFSEFASRIKAKYSPEEAGRIFRITIGVPIPETLRSDTAATESESVESEPSAEEAKSFNTVDAFTQVLSLSEEERQALDQFLALEPNPDLTPRPNKEVQDVVAKIRTFIKEKTEGPQDSRLKLNVDQRAALIKTLGWYSRNGVLHFQGAEYAKNYVVVNRYVDKTRVEAVKTAYERIARVGLLLQNDA